MTERENSAYENSAHENSAHENGPYDGELDLRGIDLSRVWTGVAAEVWRRHPGPVERIATRLLRSPGLARALLTSPSLTLPWLISTLVVFAAGGVINFAGGQPLVWLLAPAIAAIGIAYAYGPGIDPAWELSCSMAVSDRMVLLVRGLAVFAVNMALGLVASAVSGAAAPVTFGWLVPMTAMCALALAVATLARSAVAGATAGMTGWMITVLSVRVASGEFGAVVTRTALVLPYLAVTIACVVVAVAASVKQGSRIPSGGSR
jgi:hypothetical protein